MIGVREVGAVGVAAVAVGAAFEDGFVAAGGVVFGLLLVCHI